MHFKSKKPPTPKGNTIKKTPSVRGRPRAPTPQQSGFPGINDDGFILDDKFETSYPRNDLGTEIPGAKDSGKQDNFAAINEWIKVDTTESPKKSGRRISVLNRTLADPYHALLVNDATLEANDDVIENEFKTPDTPSSPAEPMVDESSSSDKTPQQTHPPMLNLILGHQDPSSRYFTRRFIHMPDPDAPNNSSSASSSPFLGSATKERPPLHLTEYDPHAYDLYKIWTCTGVIPTHHRAVWCSSSEQDWQYTWQACWPLMNAVILGSIVREPDFVDRVMDLLGEKVVKGVCADVDTIGHIFGERTEGIPDVLKRFVVDQCVDAAYESFRDVGISTLPASFVNRALETALRRLSHAGQVPLVPDCEYHTHDTLEGCYKRKMQPREIKKTRKLEQQREKSRKDCAYVVQDTRQNGIKSIDWQVRRAEGTRAARKHNERTRDGFNRMDGRRFDMDEKANAADEKAVTNGPSLPTGDGVSDLEPNSLQPEAAIFKTTQTSSAVDEIKLEPPSRAAPPPPCPVELPGSAVYVTHHIEAPPVMREESVIEANDLPILTLTERDPKTLDLSTTSSQSKPEFEYPTDSVSRSRLEKRSTCPGAFPESRIGSLRSDECHSS